MAQECRNVVVNGVHVATVCMKTGKTEAEWAAKVAPFLLLSGAPSTPAVVSPYGFRRALRFLGLYAVFDATVVLLGSEAQDWWEYMLECRRDSTPLALVLASSGIPQATMDSVFRKAASYDG